MKNKETGCYFFPLSTFFVLVGHEQLFNQVAIIYHGMLLRFLPSYLLCRTKLHSLVFYPTTGSLESLLLGQGFKTTF